MKKTRCFKLDAMIFVTDRLLTLIGFLNKTVDKLHELEVEELNRFRKKHNIQK